MYNDLAQISKAKGIHRTLAILAILSSKPVINENGKRTQEKEENKC